MLIIEDFPIFCNGDAEKMQCSSVNQAHSPGNCTFVISNSPKIGNLALTFPIACGKLINADEAACLISLDADIAQLVERLIRNHQVKGSSPFIGSIFYRGVAQFGSAFGSGPKGRRFKSCHLDQKKPEIERFPVLFLFNLHKAPSLALFSCNECATMRKGPKTMSCRAHHFTPNHIIFVPLPIPRPDKKEIMRNHLTKHILYVKIE